MARKAFFSFHYKPDNWRASQVETYAGVTERKPSSFRQRLGEHHGPGKKSSVDRRNRIAGQLSGRTRAVVLVGTETASRKWVNYEIDEAWKKGLGVVGVHIHGLKDASQNQSTKGSNPFFGHSVNRTPMSSIVKLYDKLVQQQHLRLRLHQGGRSSA